MATPQRALKRKLKANATTPVSLASTITLSIKTLQLGRAPRERALQLPAGCIVVNAISGRRYRVVDLLGSGGFGAVYRVTPIGASERLGSSCALKVATEPSAWHREAYFGDLFKNESGVVRMHESFAWMQEGGSSRPLYCLVSELVEGGDLYTYLQRNPRPWPESKARREIIRLLRVITLLHSTSAVHRDITPRNVFVTAGGVLKLGDFGIALHSVGDKNVAADAFARWFAPGAIQKGKTKMWRPADDIYQVGCLYAALLRGSADSAVTARRVKTLKCSPEAKSIIQRSIGDRRKRFADSREMLAGLQRIQRPVTVSGRVSTFESKRVVFTGVFSISRAEAKRLLRKTGGIAENRVGHTTDIVVVGEQSPHWKAEKKGQKLLDADHEREQGHLIAIIKERKFLAMVTAKKPARH